MPPPPSTSAVTGGVFAAAHELGDRPALIDLRGGHVYGYRGLVTEVTMAASGLIRRGARPNQVVGVHVDTVTAQTLAVHAVIAAGGVAAPLDPALPAGRLAERLAECDARMLITTPGLAESAVRAAEDAGVGQVIAFGDALGTIDFARLSRLEPVPLPSLDPATQAALRLADGDTLTHRDLLGAMADLDRDVALTGSDVVLATWPPCASGELVALVGLAVGRGAPLVAAHGLAPADLAGTVHDFGVTVTALQGRAIERL